MRVRFKMFSDNIYCSECDMPREKAQQLYEKLEANPMCLWGELVCEDDNEIAEFKYMDVVKTFNNDFKTAELFKTLGAIG